MEWIKLGGGRYRLRWYEAGRGSPRRTRTFTNKKDAERFANEIERRKQMRGVAFVDAEHQRVEELAADWWRWHVEPNLQTRTKEIYRRALDKHVLPRLGRHKLYEVSPQTVMTFRLELEQKGVGRHTIRTAMVVIQGMFRQAVLWNRVLADPVAQVKKPRSVRVHAVRPLLPEQVEKLRGALLARNQVQSACLVSVLAYAGLRPEEALALEWRHVRDNTLLIEQKNVDGAIVAGQKVHHCPIRTVDLVSPLKHDLAEWKLMSGRRGGLVFPNGQGNPWRKHDSDNWQTRVWKRAFKDANMEYTRPYDLRHSFASLSIRAGVPFPEIASQLGHSPNRTLSTYTHVINELRGVPITSMEDQILAARGARSGEVAALREASA